MSSHAGRIAKVRVEARVPEDTYLFLKFVGFDFSARIREFLDAERLLLELAQHRSEDR